MNNYYSILGVDKNATHDEIKKAYRVLAKKYHPDTSNDPNADSMFKHINEAYDTLKDPNKRKAYDMPSYSSESFFNSFSNFDNIFSDLFGDFKKTGSREYSFNTRRRNSDIQIQYTVTLEEAYHGATRSINMTYPNTGDFNLTFEIPKGIQNNCKIKIPQKAPVIFPELPPGDVYVNITITNHSDFYVDGSDLIKHYYVSAIDAILGCDIKIKLITGKHINVKIPAGTQTHTKIRLKQQGMPIYNTLSYGNLYVFVIVQIPTEITDEQRDLLIKFQSLVDNKT